MLHLLHGLPGSGKTTFAKKLESELPAIRFSSDEWMVGLFGHDPPMEQFRENYDRIKAIIWQNAIRLLELDVEVILDSGFWYRAERDEARSRAASLGIPCRLYYLSCPIATMRQRVQDRTALLPGGALYIDEEAFDLFLNRFEPLGSDEEYVLVNTSA